MSKEDAPNFRRDETGTCEDCKHLEWGYVYIKLSKNIEATCNKYDFIVPSPVEFHKCNSWEWET